MLTGNPLRVAIIDDQPGIRSHAQSLLEKYHEFSVVATCGSLQEALVVIPATNPHLLLLDIVLGDGTGFDLLEQIESKELKVIFLTAYQEHAVRAFNIGALHYLLKPINEDELKIALDRALSSSPYVPERLSIAKKHFGREEQKLELSTHQRWQVVDTRDIMYCTSHFGITTIYLTNDRKVAVSKYLKDFEKQLQGVEFVKTHQSYIVNLDFVDYYDKDGNLILLNGSKIPVASRREEFLMNALKDYHQLK